MGRSCRPHQILQVFAHRLFIAKIVMLLHQAVEQRLVGRLSDLLQRDRADVGERAVERRRVDQHRLWPLAPSQGIGRPETNRRQLDLAGAVSISNRPRQTMSRSAPLACFHCQASQNFSDSLRRLAVGWSAINLRIKSISSAVTCGPGISIPPFFRSMAESKLERKGVGVLFLRAHLPPYRRRFGIRIRGRQQ